MKTLALFTLSILSYFSIAQTKSSEEKFFLEKYSKNKSLISFNNNSNRNLGINGIKNIKTSTPMFNSGIGVCTDLTVLANFDNYPSHGVGFELGLTQIFWRGISVNANIGGSSNDWLWLGGSVGYTHGLYKLAPYGRLGLAVTLEALDDDGLAGYLEFGTYVKLTEWLSFKPGARIALIKTYSSWQSTNYNLLMLGFTIDPNFLIPYY
jgi:hypothetical protein